LAETCSEDPQRFHFNTVSSDLFSPNAGWQDVESTLAKVRACGDGFAEFVVDQLEELERLSSLLGQRQREHDAERRELDAGRAELDAERESLAEQRRCLERDAEQIEANSQRLEKSQADLEEARAEFAKLREASAGETGTATTALLSQLENVERERDELAQLEQQRSAMEQELAEARQQISRLADANAELAKVRGELEEARLELLRKPERSSAEADSAAEEMCHRLAELEQQRSALEQELSSSRSQISRLVDATAELAAVRGELAAARAELLQRSDRSPGASEGDPVWRERVREMQHERNLLEAELETVRRRVVEMAETAASEKQRNMEERSEWSKEFKQLRKLLEVQTRSPAPKAAAPLEAPAPVAAPVAQAAPAGGDPILESVMAQFDMLQKDIARRRSTTKSTKK